MSAMGPERDARKTKEERLRMAFIKGIAISKEKANVSSYRESITSKLQELEEIVLDMKDVSALKTIDFNLGKVYEVTKDGSRKSNDDKVLGGQAKKRVAYEEITRSRKPWSSTQVPRVHP